MITERTHNIKFYGRQKVVLLLPENRIKYSTVIELGDKILWNRRLQRKVKHLLSAESNQRSKDDGSLITAAVLRSAS